MLQTLSAFQALDDFAIKDIFGDDENVAAFGSFTVPADDRETISVSPFAVQAKVKDGLVTYLLYMEDTLGTRSMSRESGLHPFAADPSVARAASGT